MRGEVGGGGKRKRGDKEQDRVRERDGERYQGRMKSDERESQ